VHAEFITATEINKAAFNVLLSGDAVAKLSIYYGLVQQHNPILHLVAPCSPEEFAVRHILESLTLLEHLPKNAKFVDVGAGGGLPSLPCLIARDDLRAALIESKAKKAAFLETAIGELGLSDRAIVENRQFTETDPGDAAFVTCRAIDRFRETLPRLIKWSGERSLLFFGGPDLGTEMRRLRSSVSQKLMPLSERRYLFISQT
jgi:16S rRNA (guanine527-N7)-methyltransferase